MERKSSSDVLGKVVAVEDAKGQGVLLYTEDGTPRELPVPSSNPNDPLNFSPWRQRLILTAVCVYGITGFGAVQSTPLFFGKLIPEYMQKTHGVSVPLLQLLWPTSKVRFVLRSHLTGEETRLSILRASQILPVILLCVWVWAISSSCLYRWLLVVVLLSF